MNPRDLQLETKPDFAECMKRVYAWYDHQVLDRVPIRFAAHNAEYDVKDGNLNWPNLKTRWYDAEYQVDYFMRGMKKSSFLGETFPMYFPNLGPNVFAAMHGVELEFGEVTSWSKPFSDDAEEVAEKMHLDENGEYLRKINELTDVALEKCPGKFIVGYTDMHPGLDGADGMLGTENLFYALVDEPEYVHAIIDKLTDSFFPVMDAFHQKLKAHGQPSVTWMNIPSYESVHIPSCDMATMISNEHFEEFALPALEKEVMHFTHNIFHVDGKGVARHIDQLLELPNVQAYQWVQGVGEDRPIMQWVDFIKHIQNAGKSVVVDLHLNELDAFMEAVRPEGIYLCMDETEKEVQEKVLQKLLTWK